MFLQEKLEFDTEKLREEYERKGKERKTKEFIIKKANIWAINADFSAHGSATVLAIYGHDRIYVQIFFETFLFTYEILKSSVNDMT